MKTKFGAAIVDGRGKIAGYVASKNRGGSYLRVKVTPSNPSTVSQQAARARLTNFSQEWSGLTQAQRDSWNNAVTGFAKTDIFGDLRNPSGFNLYQRLNNLIAIVGGTAITVPPSNTGTGYFSSFSFTAASATPALSVIFAPVIPASSMVILEATPGYSQGKSYNKNLFRVIGTMDNADTTPFNALSLYTAKFGSIPAIGKKLSVRAKWVDPLTGQTGQSVAANFIIVA
jgi:hypothetical protein